MVADARSRVAALEGEARATAAAAATAARAACDARSAERSSPGLKLFAGGKDGVQHAAEADATSAAAAAAAAATSSALAEAKAALRGLEVAEVRAQADAASLLSAARRSAKKHKAEVARLEVELTENAEAVQNLESRFADAERRAGEAETRASAAERRIAADEPFLAQAAGALASASRDATRALNAATFVPPALGNGSFATPSPGQGKVHLLTTAVVETTEALRQKESEAIRLRAELAAAKAAAQASASFAANSGGSGTPRRRVRSTVRAQATMAAADKENGAPPAYATPVRVRGGKPPLGGAGPTPAGKAKGLSTPRTPLGDATNASAGLMGSGSPMSASRVRLQTARACLTPRTCRTPLGASPMGMPSTAPPSELPSAPPSAVAGGGASLPPSPPLAMADETAPPSVRVGGRWGSTTVSLAFLAAAFLAPGGIAAVSAAAAAAWTAGYGGDGGSSMGSSSTAAAAAAPPSMSLGGGVAGDGLVSSSAQIAALAAFWARSRQ